MTERKTIRYQDAESNVELAFDFKEDFVEVSVRKDFSDGKDIATKHLGNFALQYELVPYLEEIFEYIEENT